MRDCALCPQQHSRQCTGLAIDHAKCEMQVISHSHFFHREELEEVCSALLHAGVLCGQMTVSVHSADKLIETNSCKLQITNCGDIHESEF